jgi:site-specific recombinase XerD
MLSLTHETGLSAESITRLEAIRDRGEDIRAAARAPRTLAAYHNDWQQLQAWASTLGLLLPDPDHLTEPVPVSLLEAYLLDRSNPETPATVTPSTLTRHLAAVKWWHRSAGLVSPTDHPALADVIAGIRRTETTTTRRVRPVYLEDLTAMVESQPEGTKGLRDSAMLLLGWWGAFRRSEVAGLNLTDLTDDPQGLLVNLRQTKTDQTGAGRQVPLHYHPEPVCPVRGVRAWAAGLTDDGPLFRNVDRWGNTGSDRLSGQAIAMVVKASAARIGLDPAAFSGHSLRAGFVSECDRRGITTSAVRLVTGHQSDAMLSVYTRPTSLFDSSAGAYFDSQEVTA